MNISFIGLGKLGLPLASLFANAGNSVLCLDKNKKILKTLSRKEIPFFEPNLEEVFGCAKENIVGFTDSYYRVVQDTSCAVILVNTQLGESGYSSDLVESAVGDIAVNLRDSDKPYFTIILSSTVLPGTIKGKLIPMVENISGRVFGQGFGFSYVPDFVRLGSVIKDFINPEFLLIGSANDLDFTTTRDLFKSIRNSNCPEYGLTLEEAEIAKIALNAYVVNKISFANFLGRLCNGLENVDVHKITQAIGTDKRISHHFFKSGTPYGGTCFTRDTNAFMKFADERGYDAGNMTFSERVNDLVLKDLLASVSTEEFESVGLLGLSFKAGSPVTVGSPSVDLAGELISLGKKVYVYDSLAEFNAVQLPLLQCETAQDCIDNSDAVVIMHPDKNFKRLQYHDRFVVDFWGVIS